MCGSSSPPPGIPRDGGMADLRAAIASGQPPFAAVICENIERSGRDMYDALRLERELRAAGLPVFATDEPMDAQAPDAATILVRRMKQGIAEFFSYNLKAQMWEGLKQYTIAGYNIGLCPYGYLEDRTPHPNPMKQSMGATRARLVPDPERGPWVTRMFEWRVYEQLDCNGIARRLTELGAPSRDGRPWDYGSVYTILRNPKYTGKVVFGRRRNAGDARTPACGKCGRCRASTGPGPPTATSTPPWCPWSCGKPPRKSAASGAASATTPRRRPGGTCTRYGRGSPASSASGGCAG